MIGLWRPVSPFFRISLLSPCRLPANVSWRPWPCWGCTFCFCPMWRCTAPTCWLRPSARCWSGCWHWGPSWPMWPGLRVFLLRLYGLRMEVFFFFKIDLELRTELYYYCLLLIWLLLLSFIIDNYCYLLLYYYLIFSSFFLFVFNGLETSMTFGVSMAANNHDILWELGVKGWNAKEMFFFF